MSDSDSDDMMSSNNPISFRNNDMRILAKTSQSRINLQPSVMNDRRNLQSSSINMLQNFPQYGRSGYAESCYDHQRSILNGRSGSPMSVRSVGTTRSITSVADMVVAFKTLKCTKFEERILIEAINKFMKNRIRKNISRRRNIRMFKGLRRNSGYDSEELGSDSSLSSERSVISNDDRSVRTSITVYKGHNKENLHSSRLTSSCRWSRSDINAFKKTIEDSNCYKDCSDSLRQKVLWNVLPIGHTNENNPAQNSNRSILPIGKENDKMQVDNTDNMSSKSLPISNTTTLQERFANNFTLASQRFGNCSNRSIRPIGKENDKMEVDNIDSMSSKTLPISNKTTLQERFANHFKLPLLRFGNCSNRSILPISKKNDKMQVDNTDSMPSNQKSKNVFNREESYHNSSNTDSEYENIFSKTSIRSSTCHKVLRNKENCEQINTSPPKRNHSSIKVTTKNQINCNAFREKANDTNDEYEFIKPQLPKKTLANLKIKEKSSSKPSHLLKNNDIQNNQNLSQNCKPAQLPKQTKMNQEDNNPPQQEERLQNNQNLSLIRNKTSKLPKKQQTNQKKKQNVNNQQSPLQDSINSVSMKPSFTKRKLYTQTLDVTENKNLNGKILETSSPQKSIHCAPKEKNKARKLVTSQSCLNRDVLRDDDNILDLIHKIVPPDRINATNITNKIANNNNDDKLNFSAITSSSNDGDLSDTFTDEIISNTTCGVVNQKENLSIREMTKQKDVKTLNVKLMKQAYVKIYKIDNQKIDKLKEPSNEKNGISQVNNMYKRAELLWDSDIESDTETRATTENPEEGKRIKNNGVESDLSMQSNRRCSKRIASMLHKNTSLPKITSNAKNGVESDLSMQSNRRCSKRIASILHKNTSLPKITSNEKNGISQVDDMHRRAELFWSTDIDSDTETRLTTQNPELKERNGAKNGTSGSEKDLSRNSEISLDQSNTRSSKRIRSLVKKSCCIEKKLFKKRH